MAPPSDDTLVPEAFSVLRPVRFLRAYSTLLGRRAFLYLVAGSLVSLVLASIELAVAVVLQLLLRNLGLLAKDVATLPVLEGLSLSNTGLSVLLLVIAAVRALSQVVVGQSGITSQEAVTARLRRFALFEMLLHPDRRVVTAARVNAISGDIALRSATFAYLASTLVASLVQAGALLVVMLVASPYESIVAFVGLFVIGLVVLYLAARARRIVEGVPEQLRVVVEGIERIARNTLLVRTLRTQTMEHARLVTAVDAYESKSVHAGLMSAVSGALTPLFGVVLILVMIAVSQNVLHTAPLVLVSFLYLFLRFVQQLAAGVSYLGMCNQLWPQTKVALTYALDLGEHTGPAASMRGSTEGRARDARPTDRGTPPAVEVRGVSFRYPGQEGFALEGVHAAVASGKQLGIVGPSGRGKSTLLSLLLGLMEPTAGTITVGGRTPGDYFSDASVRVGYVGAEAFLIAGSIRDNLQYGAPFTTTDEELWAALRSARLDGTIRDLAGGLDYLIAEDGSGLSAGQKQRLCLARALLGDPHVLVLDEASANLDDRTENEIANSIRELSGRATVLIVSHRKGLLAHADQVIELGAPREIREPALSQA
ncbi:MAG TPA: ABC transporter ATP-binding protein [Polyangiaceae bacterium]|nr:ABC transporter ATP-binding protein [Polyangiaceae bacterium]